MLKTALCNKHIWAWIFAALEAIFFVPPIMIMFSVGERMKKMEKIEGGLNLAETNYII